MVTWKKEEITANEPRLVYPLHILSTTVKIPTSNVPIEMNKHRRRGREYCFSNCERVNEKPSLCSSEAIPAAVPNVSQQL